MCFPVSIAEFSRTLILKKICKRLLLIRILLHFINWISNNSEIVTKLPETFSLFLVKSNYGLTLTQVFCQNWYFLYSLKFRNTRFQGISVAASDQAIQLPFSKRWSFIFKKCGLAPRHWVSFYWTVKFDFGLFQY